MVRPDRQKEVLYFESDGYINDKDNEIYLNYMAFTTQLLQDHFRFDWLWRVHFVQVWSLSVVGG